MLKFSALNHFVRGANLLLAQQAPADLFDKAPPAVEEALKSRVTAFFEAQMAKKFRVADQYVAEDAKDAFFGADKAACRSFNWVKAVYEENFTKARALTQCEIMFSQLGTRIPVTMPLTSYWKLVEGQWFWYVPPDTDSHVTPFGVLKAGPETTKTAPALRIPKPEEIFSSGKLGKASAELDAMKVSTDQVPVTNNTPGTINLSVQNSPFPGFSAKLDKQELKPGETALVKIDYKPSSQMKPSVTLEVRVDPFGYNLPVPVNFKMPVLTPQPKK